MDSAEGPPDTGPDPVAPDRLDVSVCRGEASIFATSRSPEAVGPPLTAPKSVLKAMGQHVLSNRHLSSTWHISSEGALLRIGVRTGLRQSPLVPWGHLRFRKTVSAHGEDQGQSWDLWLW